MIGSSSAIMRGEAVDIKNKSPLAPGPLRGKENPCNVRRRGSRDPDDDNDDKNKFPTSDPASLFYFCLMAPWLLRHEQ
jgi:hypothetical protein